MDFDPLLKKDWCGLGWELGIVITNCTHSFVCDY